MSKFFPENDSSPTIFFFCGHFCGGGFGVVNGTCDRVNRPKWGSVVVVKHSLQLDGVVVGV